MKLLKNSLVLSGTSVVTLVLGLFQSFLIIRYLGASERGYLVLFQSLYIILSVLTTVGLPTSAVYYFKKELYSLSTIITSFALFFLLIVLLIFPVIYISYDYLAEIAGFNRSTPFFACLSLLGISSILYLNFSHSIFLSYGATKLVSILRLSRILMSIVVVFVVFYIYGGNLASLVLGLILNELIFAVISMWMLLKKALGSGIREVRNCLKDMLKFGIKTSLTPVLQLSQDNAPNIFIGKFIGPEAVAYFALAMSIFKGLNIIPKTITSLLIGINLDKQTDHPHLTSARVASTMMYAAAALSFPIGILATILIPPVYGNDFSNALLPLYILLGTLIVIPSGAALQISFYSENRPLMPSLLNMLGSIFLLFSVPFGAKYFGLVGAVTSIFCSRLILYFFILGFFVRISQISSIDCFRPDLESWRSIIYRFKIR